MSDDALTQRQGDAQSRLVEGARLLDAGELEAALAVFEAVADEGRGESDVVLRQQVVWAQAHHGHALVELGRVAEADGVFDELWPVLEDVDDPAVADAAAARAQWAARTLAGAGRRADALRLLDTALEQLADREDTQVRLRCCDLLLTRSAILEDLGRLDEALGAAKSVADVTLSVYADALPEVGVRAARALRQQARLFAQLKRGEDLEWAASLLTERFAAATDPQIRLAVAQGLLAAGLFFEDRKRFDKALDRYRELVGRFAGEQPPELAEIVQWADGRRAQFEAALTAPKREVAASALRRLTRRRAE